MNKDLIRALEDEIAKHKPVTDPEAKYDVDGAFELTAEQRVRLREQNGELLAEFQDFWDNPPPPVRAVVGAGGRTYHLRLSTVASGLVSAFSGAWRTSQFEALSMFDGFAAIVAGILLVMSGLTRLNKAEVFLLTLLLGAPEAKLDQEELKRRFMSRATSRGSDLELVYDRAIAHLSDLGVIAVHTPRIELKGTVFGLSIIK
jgi:hypothetical protein